MRALFVIILLLACAENASAEYIRVPSGNVDAVCGRLGHPLSRADCVRQEQVNYDLVSSLWPIASDRAKLKSIQQAESFINTTAYYNSLLIHLQAAISAEQDAADRVSTPKFMR